MTAGPPRARIFKRKMGLKEVSKYSNMRREGLKCCCGRRWKASIQSFEMTLVRRSSRNRRKVIRRTFRPTRTNDFHIWERGKYRLVRAHTVADRQVYKSFCTYELKPAIQNYILDHNNASQINKGTERAIKQFRKGLAHAYKLYGKDFYVVKWDYHNYFGSLDHEVINDIIPVSPDCRWLLRGYTDLFYKMDKEYVGVGIGGEPSQDIAVAYTRKINRMIACEPYVISAGWYMDDGYAIVHTQEEARYLLNKIVAASDKHYLQINWKQTKIYWMEKESVTWLKKRTHLTSTGKIIMKLTRENLDAERKRIIQSKKLVKQGRLPQYAADQSISCWSQYAKPYNSSKSRYRMIKFYAETFDMPWDRAKILLRRHQKGFINYKEDEHESGNERNLQPQITRKRVRREALEVLRLAA